MEASHGQDLKTHVSFVSALIALRGCESCRSLENLVHHWTYLSLSLSLSLPHTHTHTQTQFYAADSFQKELEWGIPWMSPTEVPSNLINTRKQRAM